MLLIALMAGLVRPYQEPDEPDYYDQIQNYEFKYGVNGELKLNIIQ